MLDPQRLRIFRSVLATGSFSAAAERLGYTPSAVSQHMAALGHETGLELFAKRGRGLEPTAAARALAAGAADVLDQHARLDRVVAELALGRTGTLTIGYFASAGRAWMPELARRIRAEMPHLELELLLNEAPFGTGDTRPDIDLVVDSPGAGPRLDARRRRPLITEPYVALVPARHRLAGRTCVALTELADEAWISNDVAGSACSRLVTIACDAAGVTPVYAVQAQDHHTAIAFVGAGLGITVVPRLAARDLPAKVTCLDLAEPAPHRTVVAALRHEGRLPAAVARALELLTDICSTHDQAGRPHRDVGRVRPGEAS